MLCKKNRKKPKTTMTTAKRAEIMKNNSVRRQKTKKKTHTKENKQNKKIRNKKVIK